MNDTHHRNTQTTAAVSVVLSNRTVASQLSSEVYYTKFGT